MHRSEIAFIAVADVRGMDEIASTDMFCACYKRSALGTDQR